MTKTFHSDKYGEVIVRNAMFDVDGSNLEEGSKFSLFFQNFALFIYNQKQ